MGTSQNTKRKIILASLLVVSAPAFADPKFDYPALCIKRTKAELHLNP